MRWIGVMIVLIACGCCHGPLAPDVPAVQPEPRRPGLFMQNFDYTIRSLGDRELLKGTLSLPWPILEGQTVNGMWHSEYHGPAETRLDDLGQVGPQVGSGSLIAEREGNLIRINLNPTMADNNVLLIGEVVDGAIAGRWEYATFAGIQAGGTFQARPQARF